MRAKNQAALLAAVAALLISGSATGYGMVRDEPGKPPVHFSWGYACPDGYPIRAYGRYFYPPGHPGLPNQTVEPSRCFEDVREARNAGLKPKPPPRGWQLFYGIYLAPSFKYLSYWCRQGAAAAHFAVPCPRFAPDPTSAFAACSSASICYSRGRFIMEGDFYGPPSYQGKSYRACVSQTDCKTLHNAAHAFIFAADAKHLKEIECCGGRVVAGTSRVRGRPARWLTFAGGSGLNNDHIMVEWRERGVTCAVSVYRDTPTNRGLAELLAKWVTFVS